MFPFRSVVCVFSLLLAVVGASGQPVINSPAAGQVFRAAPDYATDVLHDPWDFNNSDDVSANPDEFANWTQDAAARLNGTGATFVTAGAFRGQIAGGDSQMALLYRGDAKALNPGRSGIKFPITTAKYRRFAMKATLTNMPAINSPVIYWYHSAFDEPNEQTRRGGAFLPQFAAGSSTAIFTVELGASTVAGVVQAWTAESVVRGLRLDPSGLSSGSIAIDWVRLTGADSDATTRMTVASTGCGNVPTIVVRDAQGVGLQVATSGSAAATNFNYGIFPPGNYNLEVACGGPARVVPFSISAAPQITVLDPDEAGDSTTDYATSVLGDAWDFEQASDIAFSSNVSINAGACAGGGCGLVPSPIGGHGLLLRASSFGATPGERGDPGIYLRLPNTQPLNTRRYRLLTFTTQTFRPYDVAQGSVARIFWTAQSYTDGSSSTTSQDMRVWPGLQSYTIDLGSLTAQNGGIETECLPNCLATPWGTRSIRFLRIDPFEFPSETGFDLDTVRLTSPDEVDRNGGSFTIRYNITDADPGVSYSTEVFIDTDRNPDNGFAWGVGTIPSAVGPGQATWTPPGNFPTGSYWAYVRTTEVQGSGVTNISGAYSTGQLVVYASGTSNPQVTVISPAPNQVLPFPATIQGCAYDGAGAINVDEVVVLAIAGAGVTGPQAGQTLSLGVGAGLGTLQFGPLTGGYLNCPLIQNPSSPAVNSGFRVSGAELSAGNWTLRLMARSTISNQLVSIPDIPFQVTQSTLAPTNFQASAVGNVVTLSWQPPVVGPAVPAYVVDASHFPNFSPVTFSVIPLQAGRHSSPLASGRYYFRVVTLNAQGGRGYASESRYVEVGVGTVGAPGIPTISPTQVSASPVRLDWAPGAGGAPTNYTIYAGTAPGVYNLVVAPLGLATTVTSVAPTGVRLYVRVVASNTAGSSQSAEISFVVPGLAPPGAPSLAPAGVSDRTVNLSWVPSGGAAASYTVIARQNGDIVAALPGVTATGLTVAAPPGTYQVTVVAVNGAGTSAESNSQTVVVP